MELICPSTVLLVLLPRQCGVDVGMVVANIANMGISINSAVRLCGKLGSNCPSHTAFTSPFPCMFLFRLRTVGDFDFDLQSKFLCASVFFTRAFLCLQAHVLLHRLQQTWSGVGCENLFGLAAHFMTSVVVAVA